MMGGRGASSGVSLKGKVYGSEYHSVYQSGNIKFIVSNSKTIPIPMETMTKGRVYVTIDKQTDKLKSISYYDNEGKRTKQIDLDHYHSSKMPHTHHGYFHNENDSKKGFSNLTKEEKKMVERVNKLWLNKVKKK
jgi:hypothetical protein